MSFVILNPGMRVESRKIVSCAPLKRKRKAEDLTDLESFFVRTFDGRMKGGPVAQRSAQQTSEVSQKPKLKHVTPATSTFALEPNAILLYNCYSSKRRAIVLQPDAILDIRSGEHFKDPESWARFVRIKRDKYFPADARGFSVIELLKSIKYMPPNGSADENRLRSLADFMNVK